MSVGLAEVCGLSAELTNAASSLRGLADAKRNFFAHDGAPSAKRPRHSSEAPAAQHMRRDAAPRASPRCAVRFAASPHIAHVLGRADPFADRSDCFQKEEISCDACGCGIPGGLRGYEPFFACAHPRCPSPRAMDHP